MDLTLIRWMLSLSPLQRLEVLEATIRLKEETGHPKDRAVLDVLRAVLEERDPRKDD